MSDSDRRRPTSSSSGEIGGAHVSIPVGEIETGFQNRFGDHNNVACGLVKILTGEEGSSSVKVPIPLVSVDVMASVVHGMAKVDITQVYVNRDEEPIEAIYYFPMNPDGTVTHFQAELEGRVIKSVVKPAEDANAKLAYDAAVKSQTRSLLGEEMRADIFKFCVGFLKPGSQVKVIIGYVTELKNELGTNAIRFCIPTTIAPRYVSPSKINAKTKKEKETEVTPRPLSSSAPLSLKVAVYLPEGIKSIKSPTHQITFDKISGVNLQTGIMHQAMAELPGGTLDVILSMDLNFSGETFDMIRDFVLSIMPREAHKPKLYSEKTEDGSTAVMLHVIPSFELDNQDTELIFVLDRSGSVEGESMRLAKQALLVFLHSLPEDCYFNVVGFGHDGQEFLFPKSVKYSEKSMKTAIAHIRVLRDALKSTQMAEALKTIYAMPKIDGHLRQLFILTDGEVSNTDVVLGIVQAHANRARVFALGIGDGASHHLVEGLAKAGGGTSAFVTHNESMGSKLLSQLKNGLRPSLTDIELEWEGVSEVVPLPKNKKARLDPSVESPSSHDKQFPRRIPPVYDGSQLLVFGLFKDGCPKSVTIKGRTPDGPIRIKVKYSPENEGVQKGLLHRLAAIKLVRQLELELATEEFKGRSAARREEELKKGIVGVACKNGITSKYTSFVAVDKQEEPCPENWVMETRHVPSQIAHGFARQEGVIQTPTGTPGEKRVRKSTPGTGGRSGPRKKGYRRGIIALGGGGLGRGERNDKPKKAPKKDFIETTTLLQLINCQSFDGPFSVREVLADMASSKSFKELKTVPSELNMTEQVFATGLAISFLETKMDAQKDEWELIVKKARKWLLKSVGVGQVDAVIKVAAKFLKA